MNVDLVAVRKFLPKSQLRMMGVRSDHNKNSTTTKTSRSFSMSKQTLLHISLSSITSMERSPSTDVHSTTPSFFLASSSSASSSTPALHKTTAIYGSTRCSPLPTPSRSTSSPRLCGPPSSEVSNVNGVSDVNGVILLASELRRALGQRCARVQRLHRLFAWRRLGERFPRLGDGWLQLRSNDAAGKRSHER